MPAGEHAIWLDAHHHASAGSSNAAGICAFRALLTAARVQHTPGILRYHDTVKTGRLD